MPSVFSNEQDILEIKQEWLARLKEAAQETPRRRARLNMHRTSEDPVQEMLICFCKDSVLPPHKNANKSESFHVVEGNLDVLVFDNDGNLIRKVEMGPLGSGRTFMYRLASDPWHTVVPLSEFVIIHEVTRGPFKPTDTVFPPWAPEEGPAVTAFLNKALGRK